MKKRKKQKHRNKLNRGGMGAGMGYVVLAILAIGAFSAMMVGNITPIDKPAEKQEVILLPAIPEPSKSNLQLHTFPGITLTLPPPPEAPPQPQERGGTNYGEAPGGSSSPNNGGGQNSGAAI
jgi:hypothetical protein